MKWHQARKAFERDFFTRMLRKHKGNLSRVCIESGTSYKDIRDRMKRLGIDYHAARRGEIEAGDPPMFRAEYAIFAENALVAEYSQEAETAGHAATALVAKVVSK